MKFLTKKLSSTDTKVNPGNFQDYYWKENGKIKKDILDGRNNNYPGEKPRLEKEELRLNKEFEIYSKLSEQFGAKILFNVYELGMVKFDANGNLTGESKAFLRFYKVYGKKYSLTTWQQGINNKRIKFDNLGKLLPKSIRDLKAYEDMINKYSPEAVQDASMQGKRLIDDLGNLSIEGKDYLEEYKAFISIIINMKMYLMKFMINLVCYNNLT
ncbi:hypothetical protein [Dyadobacter sp. NIV53]|uniref:hypothetical protein n=1 Tax=Dyadobacter sp. NIV53 TaxID=2861765 RepID=UPI001C88D5B7|nr:hypothetical protein [Dyadobacter sp. NIV53]